MGKKLNFKKLILISSLVAIAPFALSAINSQNIDKNQAHSVDVYDTKLQFSDWMSNVNGNKRITQLSIPGTHDSAMFAGWSGFIWPSAKAWAKTVEWDFNKQLKAGIRFFDLRLASNMWFYHGSICSTSEFAPVMNLFANFLKAHPGETLIIRLKAENENLDRMSDSAKKDWTNKIMKVLSSSNVAPHVYSNPTNGPFLNPTLNELRGKMFFFNNMTPVMGAYRKFGAYWGDNDTMMLQDQYATEEEQKLHLVYTSLNLSNIQENDENERNRLIINFTSRSKNNSQPWRTSQPINKAVFNYLKSNQQLLRTGVLVFDYPGDAVLEEVVKRNYYYTENELNDNNILPQFSLTVDNIDEGNDFISFRTDVNDFHFELEVENLETGIRTTLEINNVDFQNRKIYVEHNFLKNEKVHVTAYRQTEGNVYYPTPQKYNNFNFEIKVVEDQILTRLLNSFETKLNKLKSDLLEVVNLDSLELTYYNKVLFEPFEEVKRNRQNVVEAKQKLKELVNNYTTLLLLFEQIQKRYQAQNLLASFASKTYLNQYFDSQEFLDILNKQFEKIDAFYQADLESNSVISHERVTNIYKEFYQLLLSKINFLESFLDDNKEIDQNYFGNKFKLVDVWGKEEYLASINSKKEFIKEALKRVMKANQDQIEEQKNSLITLNDDLIAFSNYVLAKTTEFKNFLTDKHDISNVYLQQFYSEFISSLITKNEIGLENVKNKISEIHQAIIRSKEILSEANSFKLSDAFNNSLEDMQNQFNAMIAKINQFIESDRNFSIDEINSANNGLLEIKNSIQEKWILLQETRKKAIIEADKWSFLSEAVIAEFKTFVNEQLDVNLINSQEAEKQKQNNIKKEIYDKITKFSELNAIAKKIYLNQIVASEIDSLHDIVLRAQKQNDAILTLINLHKKNEQTNQTLNFLEADEEFKNAYNQAWTNLVNFIQNKSNTNLNTNELEELDNQFKAAKANLNGEANFETNKQKVKEEIKSSNLFEFNKESLILEVDNVQKSSDLEAIKQKLQTIASIINLISNSSSLNEEQKRHFNNEVKMNNIIENATQVTQNIIQLQNKMTDFNMQLEEFHNSAQVQELNNEQLQNFRELVNIFYQNEKEKLASELLFVNDLEKETKLLKQFKDIIFDIVQNYTNQNSDWILEKYDELEGLYFSNQTEYYQVMISSYKAKFEERIEYALSLFTNSDSTLQSFIRDKNSYNAQDLSLLNPKELKVFWQNILNSINQINLYTQDKKIHLEQMNAKLDKLNLSLDQITDLNQEESQIKEGIKQEILALSDSLRGLNIEELESKNTDLEKIVNEIEALKAKINERNEAQSNYEQKIKAQIHQLEEIKLSLTAEYFSDLVNKINEQIELIETYVQTQNKEEQEINLTKINEFKNNLQADINIRSEVVNALIIDINELQNSLFTQTNKVPDTEAEFAKFEEIKNTDLNLASYEVVERIRTKVNELAAQRELFETIISKREKLSQEWSKNYQTIQSYIDSINNYDVEQQIKDQIAALEKANINNLNNNQLSGLIQGSNETINELKRYFDPEKVQLVNSNLELTVASNEFSHEQVENLQSRNKIANSVEELQNLNSFIHNFVEVKKNYEQGSLNDKQYHSQLNSLGKILNEEELETYKAKDQSLKTKMNTLKENFDKLTEEYKKKETYSTEAQEIYQEVLTKVENEENWDEDEVEEIIDKIQVAYNRIESITLEIPNETKEQTRWGLILGITIPALLSGLAAGVAYWVLKVRKILK
ncbi:hypothetical protein [Mycoplasmopsis glycophila]|uniref:1-phosphatidylinositol phosphodiesterase n=1 Tax=Mycoplasmopsis glycophila TaxID=171285 RepID=A0A449AWN1_9BACT|nr:hypothetical protein [Mycoplasmopsis glycophila]VEU71174.1 1-phosphatidylinositol phosphodiesterase precursor [Mycoplasmopsis glycophila]